MTPPLGIFPYSVLLGIGEASLLPTLVLVNTANIVVILMLLFLAYPLSFFGSRIPDRVVRSELLRFMLLGPATGMLALTVIVFMNPATRILSLPGNVFMPFAVVAVVLLWQWSVALVLPWLEKRLIYYGEDTDQLVKLQTLSTRLLTRSDLLQLLEVILEASCDYIRVSTAFVAALNNNVTELVKVIGLVEVTEEMLKADEVVLMELLQPPEGKERVFFIEQWRSFWVVPLYSRRINDPMGKRVVIGLMGIEAQDEMLDFDSDEMVAFQRLVPRAARTLD
ncbi:MAG: hypothetical protein K8I82_13465, partial [Anaerolineae bacterium]|nr:hypothetical protein [Anaerolineae bacterium]